MPFEIECSLKYDFATILIRSAKVEFSFHLCRLVDEKGLLALLGEAMLLGRSFYTNTGF